MGTPQAMLMVRDSILADERSSGAEDDLLRKTQTRDRKRRYLGGVCFRRGDPEQRVAESIRVRGYSIAK